MYNVRVADSSRTNAMFNVNNLWHSLLDILRMNQLKKAHDLLMCDLQSAQPDGETVQVCRVYCNIYVYVYFMMFGYMFLSLYETK